MLLTDAEYQQIMRCKAALKSRINGLTNDISTVVSQGKKLKDQKAAYVEEMALYDNFLSNDIKEYEDAHSVEEPTPPVEEPE